MIRIVRGGRRRILYHPFVALLNPFVYLLPVYRDLLGGIDSNSYLVTLDSQDCDLYIISDIQMFPLCGGLK